MELLPIYIFIEFPSETERFQIQERYLNFFSFPSGHDQLYKTPPGMTDEIVWRFHEGFSPTRRETLLTVYNPKWPKIPINRRKSASSPIPLPSFCTLLVKSIADGRWSFRGTYPPLDHG